MRPTGNPAYYGISAAPEKAYLAWSNGGSSGSSNNSSYSHCV